MIQNYNFSKEPFYNQVIRWFLIKDWLNSFVDGGILNINATKKAIANKRTANALNKQTCNFYLQSQNPRNVDMLFIFVSDFCIKNVRYAMNQDYSLRKLIFVAKNKHVLDQVALYWLPETILDMKKDSSSNSTLLFLRKTKTVYYTKICLQRPILKGCYLTITKHTHLQL